VILIAPKTISNAISMSLNSVMLHPGKETAGYHPDAGRQRAVATTIAFGQTQSPASHARFIATEVSR
jgi:hypothetical protein